MPFRFWCMLLLAVGFMTCHCCAQNLFDSKIQPGDCDTAAYVSVLSGKKVGLVINQASRIGNESLLDLLIRRHIRVTRIFVPEHGFRGQDDAGASVDNTVDSNTHLPVTSLYGKHKKPLPEDFKDVDVLVYDLQDVGVRFYTYISTLQYCMEACAENHVPLIILDRPDPNGFYVDGPVLQPENKSFVGMQAIPVVYGMTAGEYAKMLKGEEWFTGAASLNLSVVRCSGYTHASRYRLPVPPSPNLRTMAAVYAYPSLCLFEGTVVSVGRGTNWPFQQFGCPELEGSFSHTFTPRSGTGAKTPPYENKLCYGELVAPDETEVPGKLNNHLCLNWLARAYTAYPAKDKFFNSFFQKLSGDSRLQQQIADGATEQAIRQSWQEPLDYFKGIRKKYLLYEDF